MWFFVYIILIYIDIGFVMWICDEKIVEWREMLNIDDCVLKDVRKKYLNYFFKFNICKVYIYI